MISRPRWTDLLRAHPGAWTALGLALVAAAVTLAAGDSAFDDAYITYTFARSFAEGRGLTWAGVPVLGTSTPFLALLLGCLERLAPLGIPVWGLLLTGLAAAGTAIALAALGRREGWAWGGAVAALFWLLWPNRFGHGGSEVGMAVAAVTAAALAFASGRPLAAGAALALATLLRAEAGLAAPLLAGALAARDGWRRALAPVARAAAVAALLCAAWLALLVALTGALLPQTLAAKQAQAESALRVWESGGWHLLAAEAKWLIARVASPLGIAFAFAIAGVVVLVRRRPPFAAALVAWGGAHLVLVALLGIPRYGWYMLPFELSLLLMAGLGVECARWLEAPYGRPVRTTLAILVTALLYTATSDLHGLAVRDGDPRRASYGAVAALADRYPEGTTLASFEVGYLGYFGHRPVLDLLGLVTPETPLDAVRRGDLATVRERLAPDLLMLPLNSGSLFTATLGDPRAFLEGFRLDRLQLEGEPHLAVYRRAGLEGRGEVALDLLPALAAAGARIEIAGFAQEAGIVAVLAPGERRSIELAAGPRLLFQAGLAAPAGDVAATLELEREAGGESELVDGAAALPERAWRGWRARVPRRAAPSRLTLACAATSDGDCWIGQPHLARPPG